MIAEQLKKAVLQAAIQGKLTQQLPEDGDARDLLAEIRAEKEQLIAEGKLKKDKPLPEITLDEIPFDIPDNWCWVRLSNICSYIQRGKSPKYSLIKKYPVVAQKCNQWDGFHIEKAQFIDPTSLSKYGKDRFLQDDDLMWNSTGLGTLGRMAIYYHKDNPYKIAVADSHVTVIRSVKGLVVSKFIFYYIIGPYIQSIVEDISSGSTKQKELSTSTIEKLIIPLPPLSEQHRIVEMVGDILPEIEKLSQDEIKLDELQKSFPGQIKASILQAAIQGKLTEQLPSDGDARDLLKEIQVEKSRLIQEGKLKKYKPLPEINADEIPFYIPDNWCWVYLSQVSNSLSPKPYQILQKEIKSSGSFPVVSQGQVLIEGFSDLSNKLLHHNDPIIVFGDHTKNLKFIDFDFIVGADGTKLIQSVGIYPKFLYYSLEFNIINIETRNYGRHFKLLNSKLIPLPPLSEQHRIVKRLEALLPLCDELE